MECTFKGLTEEEVRQSRATHGSNAVTPQDVESFWDKLKENFKDPMIVILVAALVIVTVLALTGFAEWYEGVGIAAAVALATLVSTASEFKNEQTFQKLQEEASKIKVKVFRNNHYKEIGIDDVVTGDMVILQPGDMIPADGRLRSGEIKSNQAMFTGEPEPVSKKPGEGAAPEERKLEDPRLLFRGATVEDGEGVMEVERVGDKTLFGELAAELTPEDRKGPLRVKLGNLADGIAKFGYIGASFIAAAFIFKAIFMDNQFDGGLIMTYLTNWQRLIYDITTAAILAVIIIVVAVPEGLPMMIAIVLSQNMRKLLNSSVLVRQLVGIETAGSLNILFCDKTGTITRGKLEAVNFMSVTGSGEAGAPELAVHQQFREIPDRLRHFMNLSLRKNTSCVIDPHAENPTECVMGGNMTERALLQFMDPEVLISGETGEEGRVEREILFNSARKFSAVQLAEKDGEVISLIKGAPENILARCASFYDAEDRPLSEKSRETLAELINEKSEEGFRIIAFAMSRGPLNNETLPDDLVLLGFVSIRDELRDESRASIRTLQEAGIQVVMLTGDKMGTAKAIARDAGLISSDKDVLLESSELGNLSDEELRAVLPDLKVISRCLPSDKSRLVKVAQDAGLVVGMTGDGVNDAPALSNCDIGFGMGSGSEVAKEASEIVILDDNISSIVNAVHYGRTIYRSIQKFITFQLTVNVSAIAVAFVGPFLGFRLPLTMIQLLWVNLIMDTLAALAFSGEPPLDKHMAEKPKAREENIITPYMWSSILFNGFFIAGLSVFYLKSPVMRSFFPEEGVFLTGFFAFFVFANNFNKFNVRVEEMELFDHIFENRGFLRIVGLIFGIQILLTYFGGEVFRTVALDGGDWIVVTLLSASIILFDLTRKAVRNLMQ